MPLPRGTSLRSATVDDLPVISALREAADMGVQDWSLRLAIEPDNARCFAVTDEGGSIIGVGSGVAYGPVGVVGNMVVAEAHRRRGIGSALLDVVCDFLTRFGCLRLELNATELGRPLYAAHGFEFMDPGSFARFPRGVELATAPGVGVDEGDASDLEPLIGYDAKRFGGERRAILTTAVAHPHWPVLVARRNAAILGYGWLRVEGDRIGPWVADEPAVAAAILAEAFRRSPDADELQANGMPTSNAPGVAWLRSLGAEAGLWDGRMARGPRIPRRDETIYGAVTGALG